MSWLYYLLESNLYLILFYGLYKIALQRETFFGLNRFYLIASSILALAFPFIQLGFLKEPIVMVNDLMRKSSASEVQYSKVLPLSEIKQEFLTVDLIVAVIYILVAFSLLVKLILNIMRIVKMKNQSSTNLGNRIKLIELNNSKMAFSFFKLIFLDPHLPDKHTIIKHELAHINQKHSFDVLFFEILQIVNWFNPVLHFVKKDIKLLHEYMADEETTDAEIERYDYAIFLIQNSVDLQNFRLTNQIFGSSILKKRITMLNQKKSANWARLKMLLLLPLICGVLALSTMAFTKDYNVIDLYPKSQGLLLNNKGITNLTKNRNNSISRRTVLNDEDESFYPLNTYNIKTNNAVNFDTRYIIINGKPIKDNSKFYGLRKAKSVKYLPKLLAIKKYGREKGSDGAVEISGDRIEFLGKIQPPPPVPNPKQTSLSKTILLPPPPKIDTKKKLSSFYSVNVNLNRAKNEKLVSPESIKSKKSLSIYSERGEKVFITSDYKDNWDGKLNSFTQKPLTPGEYSYEMIFEKTSKTPSKTLRGYISLK